MMYSLIYCVLIASFIGSLMTIVANGGLVTVRDNVTSLPPSEIAEIDKDCYQPKEIGKCFALFYRFAYNVESGQCEQFIYGGCGGNQNNFETKSECELKCQVKAINLLVDVPTETTPISNADSSTQASST